MVSNNDSDNDDGPDDLCYTGFTILAPHSSRKCRVVRGRRYRPAAARLPFILRKALSFINEMVSPSPPPPARGGGGAMKRVAMAVASGVYFATTFAFAIALDFPITFAATMVIAAWFGIGPTPATASVQEPGTPNKTPTLRHRNCSGRRHGIERREQLYLKRVLGRRGKVSRKHRRPSAGGHGLAFVRGGVNPGESRRSSQRQTIPTKRGPCRTVGQLKKPLAFWDGKEKDWLSKYTSGEWKEAEYNKKLEDTQEVRDDAKQEDLAQQQQQEQERAQREAREEEERAQREAREQAERDQACWACKELDHRPDNDLLVLCDGDDCMNASHVKCNDPPLPGVPKDDVSL